MEMFMLLLVSYLSSVHSGKINECNMKNITMHVVTWNVNGERPTCLLKLLGQFQEKDEDEPDMVIVGLQEVTKSIDTALKDYFLGNRWEASIGDILESNDYVKVETASLFGMFLNVYVKIQHSWSVADVNIRHIDTEYFRYYDNKGGVIMKFRLYGRLFCLVHAHLHGQNKTARIEDYKEIEQIRTVFCENPSDYVFFLGDLNFHIRKVENLKTPEEIHALIKDEKYDELLKEDELLYYKNANKIFRNYTEQPIKFPPTYKFLLKRNKSEYNLKRRPAWTDRILYKTESEREITPISYNSMEDHRKSDHYPVEAI
uniref:Pc24, similar to salivary inositol polyphosphate 5-phosphatase n=1 Tax=Panstrongylus chinai TaxID=156444 RepID=A0A286T531_9HEMI|nr:Pc24, similar to salivary inositol polyphosphate 5-phosphatase [Panstrongylus chinai]